MNPFAIVTWYVLKNFLSFSNFCSAISYSSKEPFAFALSMAAYKSAGPVPWSPPSLIAIKAAVTSVNSVLETSFSNFGLV
jgi:hypothetical protein